MSPTRRQSPVVAVQNTIVGLACRDAVTPQSTNDLFQVAEVNGNGRRITVREYIGGVHLVIKPVE